jgi:hypothetical protein
MMNRGKSCRHNGDKMQSNLENLKFFKPSRVVLIYQCLEIIKIKILFKNSKLHTNQVF